MGLVLLAGGGVGAAIGVVLFSILRHFGQIDLVINTAYVVMLAVIGTMMAFESVRALLRVNRAQAPSKLHRHGWIHGLPLKMRFKKSRLYISAILPIGIGFAVGIISALLGVGGAFMLVPAMIYLLGMPTVVVVGTSLFQVIFVAGIATLLQSVENRTVDVMLALVLTIGSVIGAQIGSRLGSRLPAEQLRLLLALLILTVAAGLLYVLVAEPDNLFELVVVSAR